MQIGALYTEPKLEDRAKARCASCFALGERDGVAWCELGDIDITAVLKCAEWAKSKPE